jgi:2-keto-3-deoxy-6-phosphogluconate aldolase
VGVESISRYLGAGAIAVGLGGALFPAAALKTADAATVARLAKEVIEVLG